MKVAILGNGVAGTTCAMTLRQEDRTADVVLISKESPYFYSRTALMYAFMDRMTLADLEPFERKVYDHQRIERIHDAVVDVDFVKKTLSFAKGDTLSFDRLVLATGAMPHFVPWQGLEDLAKAHDGTSSVQSGIVHLVSLQDLEVCESLVSTTKRAVVVGGGLIGIELVECLVHHGVRVTFLVREDTFWPAALNEQESAVVVAHMRAHGVDVRLGEAIGQVKRETSGRVCSVVTSKGDHLACDMLGVCIGVKPSVGFLKGLSHGPQIGSGVLTDRFLRTTVEHVFACGDCAEIDLEAPSLFDVMGAALGTRKRVIELNWYAAKRQGAVAAHNVLGRMQAYRPPMFFNSSKFFDIEFTNVGFPQLDAKSHPATVFNAPSGRSILRIVHEEPLPQRVLSFNVLGARVDHALLASWVEQRRGLAEVLARFHEAQLDVEFGRVPFERSAPMTLAWPQMSSGGAL